MPQWSWEDEEEEEELFLRPPARPATGAVAGAHDDTERGSDDGSQVDEDAAGLEERWSAEDRDFEPRGATARGPMTLGAGAGGFNIGASAWADEPWDDDDVPLRGGHAFLHLGSERIDREAPAPGGLWRQLGLAALVLAGLWVAARDRRPSEASFRELRSEWYEQRPAMAVEAPGRVVMAWGLPLLTDRSFEGQVAWSRYVDHGPFAWGTVRLRAAAGAKKSSAAKPVPVKLYDHRFLGVLGTWVPVPYLPQPGTKANMYGVGACVLSRCLCVPKFSKRLPASKAPEAAHLPKDSNSTSGVECLRFEGGKSAVLNVMAFPIIGLFLLWQFPSNWASLSSNAVLSMANVARGRLWVLLSAPFSHRGWSEAFHCGVMLASTIDSFDRAEVSFAIFLALYLGGSWAAWFGRSVLHRRVVENDAYAFYAQEWGSAGGIAAQLLFLARVRPEERFQFSLYFVPIPVTLTAWQSCFAHGLLDILSAKEAVFWRQLCAHISAWALGWVLAGAWQKHI